MARATKLKRIGTARGRAASSCNAFAIDTFSSFVLLQYTRVTDGRTDRRTDRQTDNDRKTVLRSRTVKTAELANCLFASFRPGINVGLCNNCIPISMNALTIFSRLQIRNVQVPTVALSVFWIRITFIYIYISFFCFFFAAPTIEALIEHDVTQTTVPLSWSIGNTQHVDLIQVYWRQMDSSESAAGPWWTKNSSSHSSHTVMSLTPGTMYEFYVEIKSYRLTARTDPISVTTGATTLACHYF